MVRTTQIVVREDQLGFFGEEKTGEECAASGVSEEKAPRIKRIFSSVVL